MQLKSTNFLYSILQDLAKKCGAKNTTRILTDVNGSYASSCMIASEFKVDGRSSMLSSIKKVLVDRADDFNDLIDTKDHAYDIYAEDKDGKIIRVGDGDISIESAYIQSTFYGKEAEYDLSIMITLTEQSGVAQQCESKSIGNSLIMQVSIMEN